MKVKALGGLQATLAVLERRGRGAVERTATDRAASNPRTTTSPSPAGGAAGGAATELPLQQALPSLRLDSSAGGHTMGTSEFDKVIDPIRLVV